MKRFLIGHFGVYDVNKQQRDFREDFYGVEACMLNDNKEIDRLIEASRSDDFNICVHFPLRSNKWRLRDPQYMSNDIANKNSSYDYIDNELTFMFGKFKPHYVLFHYPKPVILDSQINWSNWRFADETEYAYDDKYTYDDFAKHSEQFFQYISKKAAEFDFIPVLEFDALNKYVCDNDALISLLKKYPNVKVCLDIARLHLQHSIDSNFNPYEILDKYAEFTEVVHVSNGRLSDNFSNNHYPALPELKSVDGWADVEKYFRIINSHNNSYKVLFEHRSEKITDEQLENCYEWINELIK
ncbi:hypothetical protein SH1V18_25840 [Vallitalea longa]|uniref:Xylose isomerase-like TIM barrel domain-containing protein n=1 Tax=Vallitalea longa TaxID=2936439 RepID=A0A9W5YBK6_9FIRM|nr:sugar phosphate isomerase/epimerase [Vallitalea longa]GKX30104.1 hypothetical protein SH1V18_25840 [Vallitalea longa]